jgi:hypothetical protein
VDADDEGLLDVRSTAGTGHDGDSTRHVVRKCREEAFEVREDPFFRERNDENLCFEPRGMKTRLPVSARP